MTVSKRKGFTLIELLVVIAIISLLVSILLPSLHKAKDLARVVECLTTVKNLSSAMALYQANEGGVYPSFLGDGQTYTNPDGSTSWVNMWVFSLINAGLIEAPNERANVLICPFDESVSVLGLQHARSYVCNYNFSIPGTSMTGVTPINPDAISSPGNTVFMCEWWHGDQGMETAYGIWWNTGWAEKSIGFTFDHHNDGRSTVLFFDMHIENLESQYVGDDAQHRWAY